MSLNSHNGRRTGAHFMPFRAPRAACHRRASRPQHTTLFNEEYASFLPARRRAPRPACPADFRPSTPLKNWFTRGLDNETDVRTIRVRCTYNRWTGGRMDRTRQQRLSRRSWGHRVRMLQCNRSTQRPTMTAMPPEMVGRLCGSRDVRSAPTPHGALRGSLRHQPIRPWRWLS